MNEQMFAGGQNMKYGYRLCAALGIILWSYSFGFSAMAQTPNTKQENAGAAYAADINRTVNLMRKYCKACHAINPLKFIISNNNVQVWQYIISNPAPSGGRWIDQIELTLNWPSSTPPSGPFRPGRDYMPKGSKRHEIVGERIGNLDARQYMYLQVKGARMRDAQLKP